MMVLHQTIRRKVPKLRRRLEMPTLELEKALSVAYYSFVTEERTKAGILGLLSSPTYWYVYVTLPIL